MERSGAFETETVKGLEMRKTLMCMPGRAIGYVEPFVHLSRVWLYSATRGVQIQEYFPQSTPPEVNRNLAIDQMYQHNCGQILYVDADQSFPPDLLFRLESHKKEIVGVNCPRRVPPFDPVMKKDIFNKPLNYKKKPLVKMKKIGFAATLIQKEVFDAMPDFVFYRKIIDRKTWIGEDYIFCEAAREAGFAVYCDLLLSEYIGHIGNQTHFLRDK